ncbi:PLP-dependent cysteine synthase family protein [Corynebacterium belfantii]|uniref:PLP-dependent cysteine synthase family protein n=1 Tax=Corynebacterium belfantii TaxID=2014537 RepID=UPI0018D2E087|nr:cysteine synthase family protein [Corynebacterium belfantii]MBG9260015.1 cysteine synthase family protein [Corynebacterium belfantii]MBG9266780.1 cysteine synthase family protein [Corynebacterium belfantii]MBG9320286.1 cysteine synthase family protein [Corynebacterium belfantii]
MNHSDFPRPIARKVSELIGNTPLFELLKTQNNQRVLLKLESFNPTGSAKIRMAQSMINSALRESKLEPGGTIVESTSGNTGQGLAALSIENDFNFHAIVDNHACKDKLNFMKALGSTLHYVAEEGDGSLSTSAREDLAEKLGKANGWHFTKQHDNDANALGYYSAADEIIRDLGDAPNFIISPVGTGGSLFGVTERLRQQKHHIKAVGVEPEGSIAFGGPGHDYFQSGTGTPLGAVIGTAVRYDLLNSGIKVSDAAAFATCRAVAMHSGILLGGSAGGAVAAILDALPNLPDNVSIVTIACDGGEKYLDTVYNDEWLVKNNLHSPMLEHQILSLLQDFNNRSGITNTQGIRIEKHSIGDFSRVSWCEGDAIPNLGMES